MRGMDFAGDFRNIGSYTFLGSVTVTLGEELCRIRSEDVFTVLISYENSQHGIYFFPERADNIFYFEGLVVDLCFGFFLQVQGKLCMCGCS